MQAMKRLGKQDYLLLPLHMYVSPQIYMEILSIKSDRHSQDMRESDKRVQKELSPPHFD